MPYDPSPIRRDSVITQSAQEICRLIEADPQGRARGAGGARLRNAQRTEHRARETAEERQRQAEDAAMAQELAPADAPRKQFVEEVVLELTASAADRVDWGRALLHAHSPWLEPADDEKSGDPSSRSLSAAAPSNDYH